MEWRVISEYQKYEVSENGDVRTIKTGRVLSKIKDHKYLIVNLYKDDGSRKKMKVHRLVASAFLPLVANKNVVDHINECTTDNNVSNLRWCTQEENIMWYHYCREYTPTPKKKVTHTPESDECKAARLKKASIEMSKSHGKPIMVNNELYRSCGTAAQMIVDALPEKNKATVSKELRKFLARDSEEMCMYKMFTVTRCQ